jgi:predicted nucleic acid-binding protein
MSFVLDSSLTIAWFLPDERSTPTQILLERAGDDGVVVPDFWRLEIGNALLLATRRKRLTIPQRAEALRHLASLPIMVDTETSAHAWITTMELADRFKLTLYDACYLELAKRRALPLATLDKDLRAAGRKLGIPLL